MSCKPGDTKTARDSYQLERIDLAFTFLMGAKFLAAVATGSPTTMVVDKGLYGQLLRLDPQTRLEQTCDTEILRQINREKAFNVDKVIAYTFGDPIIRDNRIKAPGAVLRSDGE